MFATSRRWLRELVDKVVARDSEEDPVCWFCRATPVTNRSVSDYQCSGTMFALSSPVRAVVIIVNADTDDPLQVCLDCTKMVLLAATTRDFIGR